MTKNNPFDITSTPYERAAQLWCLPDFENRQMDPPFAFAIGMLIDQGEQAIHDKYAPLVEAATDLCDNIDMNDHLLAKVLWDALRAVKGETDE